MKIYLSNWYQPPCDSDNNVADEKIGFVHDGGAGSMPSVALNNREDQVMMAILETVYNIDRPIVLDENSLRECKNLDCQSAQRMIEFSKKHFGKIFNNEQDYASQKELLPILMYFGTTTLAELDITYPLFASYRSLASDNKSVKKSAKGVDCSQRAQRVLKNALQTVSKENVMSPIIWDVYDTKTTALTVLDADVSWGAKLNKAVWRGKLSGEIKGDTFEEKCKSNQRCQLIQSAAVAASASTFSASSLIDAGVTQQRADFTLDKSLHLVKSPMTIEEQLKYQIIIVVEGDGYATNLSWALYSNSVVIMPKPSTTSYLMEEKLEPWIHYIPCKNDFSDLKKKVHWVMKNGPKAKKIAERATLWIHDLYMSDDAVKENEEIAKFVLKRYMDFYVRE